MFKWLQDWVTWFPRNPKHFRLSVIDCIDVGSLMTLTSCEEPWDSTFGMDDLKKAYELIRPTIEHREKLIKEVLKHPLGRMHLELAGIDVPIEWPELKPPEIKSRPFEFSYPFGPIMVNTPKRIKEV